MDYVFSVQRNRISVTQGEATVLLNGMRLITFGDKIELIKEGETYYGELIGGWASVIPDGHFIHGVLFHPHDNYYCYSEKVRRILKPYAKDGMGTGGLQDEKN